MATRRKPWPSWAGMEYREILRAARALARMARTAIEECFNDLYDIPLLEQLLPRMVNESLNIQLVVKRVQTQRRARGERWPRWATWALEESSALAMEAEEQAGLAIEDIKPGNWPLVEQGVHSCLRIGRRIERHMLGGPPPETVLTVLQEAEEVARGAWKGEG